MSFWDKAKDASVEARRRDEEYHARALREINAGIRRDGLWAMAVTSTSTGDQAAIKLTYLKLLVQAIKDDDHIASKAMQQHQSQTSAPAAQPQLTASSKPTAVASPVAQPKLGILKTLWYCFLVFASVAVLCFGFLPGLLNGVKPTLWHILIACFWVYVFIRALTALRGKEKF